MLSGQHKGCTFIHGDVDRRQSERQRADIQGLIAENNSSEINLGTGVGGRGCINIADLNQLRVLKDQLGVVASDQLVNAGEDDAAEINSCLRGAGIVCQIDRRRAIACYSREGIQLSPSKGHNRRRTRLENQLLDTGDRHQAQIHIADHGQCVTNSCIRATTDDVRCRHHPLCGSTKDGKRVIARTTRQVDRSQRSRSGRQNDCFIGTQARENNLSGRINIAQVCQHSLTRKIEAINSEPGHHIVGVNRQAGNLRIADADIGKRCCTTVGNSQDRKGLAIGRGASNSDIGCRVANRWGQCQHGCGRARDAVGNRE